MKIDFTQKLPNLDGSITEQSPMLKEIAISALLAVFEEDKNMSGVQKFELGAVAQKIHGAVGIEEIAVEDVATIKKRIGIAYGPAVVLVAWKALESAA